MHDINLRHRHAELIGDQLREGGFMALAMAMRAGQHRHAAGWVHADGANLIKPRAGAKAADNGGGRDAAGFQIGGTANTAQLAALGGFRTTRREAGPIRRSQSLFQGRVVIAAVILQRDRRLIGELIGLDEVPPTEFHPVNPGLLRRHIHQAFQQEGRFRPASAAIGIHRHGIGENGLHFAIDHRRGVHAGQQRGVKIGRYTGREGGKIGAHIGLGCNAQAQDLAMRIQRQFRVAHMVAPMGIRHEAFGTIRGPAHRAAQLAGRPGDNGFFGIVINLAAKATADIRRDHAQLRFRQMQHMRAHQQANNMRVLAGSGERVIARGAIKLTNG